MEEGKRKGSFYFFVMPIINGVKENKKIFFLFLFFPCPKQRQVWEKNKKKKKRTKTKKKFLPSNLFFCCSSESLKLLFGFSSKTSSSTEGLIQTFMLASPSISLGCEGFCFLFFSNLFFNKILVFFWIVFLWQLLWIVFLWAKKKKNKNNLKKYSL